MRRLLPLVLTACTVLAVAGCSSSGGSSEDTSAGAPSSAANPTSTEPTTCSPSTLKTFESGVLTIATDSPAFEPWFKDDKPANGEGFESAVAFAVATQLGYAPGRVKWKVESFNSVVAPTPKKFDFDINQVSITTERAKAVDFSSGYYDVAQAVVALKDNKYADSTTVKELRGAKLGAQKGSTSLEAINSEINPTNTPAEYPSNELAVQALKNGSIDGLVVDLPTGLFLTAAEIENSKIIGQLPVTGVPEKFGLVLDQHSPLTSCVTRAVDTLRTNGTLAALEKQWLTDSAGAPVLN